MFFTIYTVSMSFLVKSTRALPPKTKDAKTIAYFYAAILFGFATFQVITFERFSATIISYWLPIDDSLATLLAAFIITAELFAIPFLVRLRMSPAARVLSMILGWTAPVIWLVLTLWAQISVSSLSSVGMLGGVVELAPGWWAVCVSAGLVILAAWASWGLWPFTAKK